MSYFTDQLGNNVKVPDEVRRVVSLVPSQSELIWALGAGDRLCGITRFCVHPPEMHQKVTRVGGTKKLNLHTIRELNPDLIIGNKEENDQEQIKALSEEFPVWMSDVVTMDDALSMITSVGDLLDTKRQAAVLVRDVSRCLDLVKGAWKGKTVAYLIWQKPIMIAGTDTFIGHLLQWLGLHNVAPRRSRYPVVTMEELKSVKPDLLFLSSEPYPFAASHKEYYDNALPDTKVELVDGEVFSWYGPRLILLKNYIPSLVRNL